MSLLQSTVVSSTLGDVQGATGPEFRPHKNFEVQYSAPPSVDSRKVPPLTCQTPVCWELQVVCVAGAGVRQTVCSVERPVLCRAEQQRALGV